MSTDELDEEWPDPQPVNHPALSAGIISEVEQRVISRLSDRGYRFVQLSQNSIAMTLAAPDKDPTTGNIEEIPRNCIPDLDLQLSWNIIPHPRYEGFVAPEIGYIEFELTSAQRSSSYMLARQIARLQPEESANCHHSSDDMQFPSLEFSGNSSTDAIINPRLHLHDSRLMCCIEVSNTSPLAALENTWRGGFGYRGFTGTIKLKLRERPDKDALLAESERLLQSFLYEINVRHNITLNPRRRDSSVRYLALNRYRSSNIATARFPRTTIAPEVSALFNFASSAGRNYPLAFLSYYQTLEYFIPAAVRRNALSDIRKVLTDLRFERSSDESLLRLVSVAEGATNASEAQQFKTLLKECVRQEEIEEFLRNDLWGDHFTKRGPIVGVDPLNLSGTNTGLMERAADRIYRIRNRIVHAKDDPRYRDSPVLLPQSEEADALGPDVQLIRLLAIEVILDSQTR
ncbi:hypothetical protein [Nonomuraea jiangxiensis]|nr:hypothetical protein [Nonomuraea jiangxiensis]